MRTAVAVSLLLLLTILFGDASVAFGEAIQPITKQDFRAFYQPANQRLPVKKTLR